MPLPDSAGVAADRNRVKSRAVFSPTLAKSLDNDGFLATNGGCNEVICRRERLPAEFPVGSQRGEVCLDIVISVLRPASFCRGSASRKLFD
jgi:hypothetical protein